MTPADATPSTTDALQTRLRRIEGQVRGIARMLEDGRTCEDVVTQLMAIRSSIDTVGASVLDQHLCMCVEDKDPVEQVVALDVGHNQLDWKIRSDTRVFVIEGANARNLSANDLPADARRFDIVTIDVSFISLKHILPVVPPLLATGGQVVALVKPQFEAGREEVGKGGIIRDEAVHTRVVEDVTAAAQALGFTAAGLVPSPITGAEGNREFLLLLRNED